MRACAQVLHVHMHALTYDPPPHTHTHAHTQTNKHNKCTHAALTDVLDKVSEAGRKFVSKRESA